MATDATNAAHGGARRLYVYYRVPAAQLDAALQAATAMQQRLCAAHPGLQAELLCKSAGDDGISEPAAYEPTLMEIYRREDGAGGAGGGDGSAAGALDLDAALQAAIASAAQREVAGFISGRRHVEAFVPFTPCAC